MVRRIEAHLPLLPFLPSSHLPPFPPTHPRSTILQGHTLLSRHSGSVAPALTAAVESYSTPASSSSNPSNSSTTPLSSTSLSPQPPQSLEDKLTGLMNRAPVMLFMKGNPDAPQCGFSRQTVALLRGEGVQFGWFDIFSDQSVREGLKKHNDWPSECSRSLFLGGSVGRRREGERRAHTT